MLALWKKNTNTGYLVWSSLKQGVPVCEPGDSQGRQQVKHSCKGWQHKRVNVIMKELFLFYFSFIPNKLYDILSFLRYCARNTAFFAATTEVTFSYKSQNTTR